MSLEEFLVWDEQQEERYEYVDGRAAVVDDPTEQHDDVRTGIICALGDKLKGTIFRVRLGMRLVCATGNCRRPDGAVSNAPRDPQATLLRSPVLLVEVASPATRATDYIAKSKDYDSVSSVLVYLIVDPFEPNVDVFRRKGGVLTYAETISGLRAAINLPELGTTLQLEDVYPDPI